MYQQYIHRNANNAPKRPPKSFYGAFERQEGKNSPVAWTRFVRVVVGPRDNMK